MKNMKILTVLFALFAATSLNALKMDNWNDANAEGRLARVDLPYGSYLKQGGSCAFASPGRAAWINPITGIVLEGITLGKPLQLLTCTVNGKTHSIYLSLDDYCKDIKWENNLLKCVE